MYASERKISTHSRRSQKMEVFCSSKDLTVFITSESFKFLSDIKLC
jgi:hypothetical protein